MFEQDYIMRQIHQIIQVLMKMIFNIDSASPATSLIKDAETRKIAEDMLRNADSGNAAEAEKMLFSLIQNKTPDNLLAGIVFYSHINEKDDEYFEANNYSHNDAKNGMKKLLAEYELEHIANLFFYD